MSRPYININSATYDTTSGTDVVTLDITALRLRGQEQITISGFTQSIQIPLTDGYYSNSTFTFSANIDGRTASGNSANATYTAATREFVFSGIATGPGATATNLKMTIWGLNGGSTQNFVVFGAGGYTFSSTQNTATAVQNLANAIIAGSLPNGVTATSSNDKITLTATTNTGAFYNGNVAKIESTSLGTLGFTFSSSYYTSTWGGGKTTLTLGLTSSSFGEIGNITFDVL